MIFYFHCPQTKLREGKRCLSGGGGSVQGLFVQGGSLSGGGVSTQVVYVWGVSVQEGLCHGDPPPPVTVEERAVRILLECTLVALHFY